LVFLWSERLTPTTTNFPHGCGTVAEISSINSWVMSCVPDM
jgi:hypothetical protein